MTEQSLSWLRARAGLSPDVIEARAWERRAFVVNLRDELAQAVTAKWLAHHAPHHSSDPSKGESQYLFSKWVQHIDTRRDLFSKAVAKYNDGNRPDLNYKANVRGKVRTAQGGPGVFSTTAHGSIPWYVPAGAEWDMEAERSTREWSFRSKVGDSVANYKDRVEDWELVEYHERADQLHFDECETDDWISPPRRACRYYEDEILNPFVPSDESYLQDGLDNGTSVEQDRAVNNRPEPRTYYVWREPVAPPARVMDIFDLLTDGELV